MEMPRDNKIGIGMDFACKLHDSPSRKLVKPAILIYFVSQVFLKLPLVLFFFGSQIYGTE